MTMLPLFVQVDPALPEPLHAQVYRGLRAAISEGRVGPRENLPSTRSLANDLRVGRNTVLRAIERLKAEGLVEGRVGSGVRVKPGIAVSSLLRSAGTRANAAAQTSEHEPFLAHTTPLDVFPADTWARVAARRWRKATRGMIETGDALGHPRLREIIADYLATARGVQCSPEQVLITSGAHHAFELAMRAVVHAGDGVWIENPGRPEIAHSLTAAGMHVIPVPVDREGFQPTIAARLGDARLCVVTPGCHFPTGISLSLQRRNQLVDWARSHDAWLVEDDQFSVTRFVGRQLPTIHSLDRSERTILIGSFAHILFPGLRVGYAVLPDGIREKLLAARVPSEQHTPTSVQAILADFIDEGHLSRHLGRLREVIAERYAALAHGLSAECGTVLDPWPAVAGVHVVAWLPGGLPEQTVVNAAANRGVQVAPVSKFSQAPVRDGIVLGFGGWSVQKIEEGVRQLAKALQGIPHSVGHALRTLVCVTAPLLGM